MNPDYVGFLTLRVEPGAPMLEEIRSGQMELLTPEDVVDEMELFLGNVDSDGSVFRANHASNYIMLRGNLNADIPAMQKHLAEVRARHGFRAEGFRAL